MKPCTKCKNEFPATLEYFYRDRSRKDGMTHRCKICDKKRVMGYCHSYNKEKYREFHKTVKGHLVYIWKAMLQRCNNPNRKDYKYYGEKGVAVKFKSFREFYDYTTNVLKADPRGLTIDRMDNEGHYEKGNIRFVTMAVNAKNRRKVYRKRTYGERKAVK
jgi:hypothetical protein